MYNQHFIWLAESLILLLVLFTNFQVLDKTGRVKRSQRHQSNTFSDKQSSQPTEFKLPQKDLISEQSGN